MTRPTPTERFRANVDRTSGHGPRGTCWVWTGLTKKGYGVLQVGDYTVRAHRFAYEQARGTISNPAMVVRHKCDNRLCVRTIHLILGTHQDNMNDMVIRVRAGKLSYAQVKRIRTKWLTSRYSQRALGLEFKCSPGNIGMVCTGKSCRYGPWPTGMNRAAYMEAIETRTWRTQGWKWESCTRRKSALPKKPQKSYSTRAMPVTSLPINACVICADKCPSQLEHQQEGWIDEPDDDGQYLTCGGCHALAYPDCPDDELHLLHSPLHIKLAVAFWHAGVFKV